MARVLVGETMVDPALAQELVSAPKREDPLAALTARERQVLALIAEGRTDRGIREALWLSQKTVEAHVRSIFRKLDLPSTPSDNRRVHAVLAFMRHASTQASEAL
jgi:DNA-binding NarL/FixJ family response regulator